MRHIAIGDIHGEITLLKSLLKDLNVNFKTDKLIFLGDYIDRGENSYEVVKYVRALQRKHPTKVICLKGNHEDLFLNDVALWRLNGGTKTENDYRANCESNKEFKDRVKWFESLPLYYETKNNVFVHGGIDPSVSLAEQNSHYMMWAREDYLYDDRKFDKKVISGHTPSMVIIDKDCVRPYETLGGNYVIDTGACFGGCLTACIIENGKYNFISVRNGEENNIE